MTIQPGAPLTVPGSVFISGPNFVGTGTVVGNGNWVLTAGHVINSNGGNGVNFTVTPMNVGGTALDNAAAVGGVSTTFVDAGR